MWFKVDDSFWSHPKVIAAGNAAIGLWARCGSYAAQHMTDGFIPASLVKQIGSPPQVRKLLDAGLWSATQEGFVMHDWADYQPTRATAIQRREADAERQRNWRARHPGRPVDNTVDGPVDDLPADENRERNSQESHKNRTRNTVQLSTEPQVNGTSHAVTNSAPTRPVPTEEPDLVATRTGRHARQPADKTNLAHNQLAQSRTNPPQFPQPEGATPK